MGRVIQVRPTIWPDSARPLKGGWALTCDRAESSYGIPVLVSPDGQVYGPGDTLSQAQVAELRGVTPGTVRLSLDTGALEAAKLPGLAVRLVYAAHAVGAKRKPGREKAQKEPRP